MAYFRKGLFLEGLINDQNFTVLFVPSHYLKPLKVPELKLDSCSHSAMWEKFAVSWCCTK